MITNRKISQKREKKAAENIKGRAHAASGALWNKKSDLSNETFLVEDKFTHKDNYSIKLDILLKVEREAKQINKIPILRFGFEARGKNFAVIRNQDFPKKIIPHFSFNKKGKSVLFTYEELLNIYIKAREKEIAIIRFMDFKREYIIMKWEDFVDTINIFTHI
jgi:hypothetical protein